MCWCRFVCCNHCPALGGTVDSGAIGEGGVAGSIWFIADLSVQFCYEPKPTLKSSILKRCSGVTSNFLWGLSPSAAVGIGFYGNSETNDGVYQLIYSLDNANHTFSGIDALVRLWAAGQAGRSPRGQCGWNKGPSQSPASSAPRGAGHPLEPQLVLPGANRQLLLLGREVCQGYEWGPKEDGPVPKGGTGRRWDQIPLVFRRAAHFPARPGRP